MDSMINLLFSKAGLTGKYIISVLVSAIVYSWYGIENFDNENFIKELINYTILILPIHASLTFVLFLMLYQNFRRYLIKEKRYKHDKLGNIFEWKNICPYFNHIAFKMSYCLTSYMIIGTIYILYFVLYPYKIHELLFMTKVILASCCIFCLMIRLFAFPSFLAQIYNDIKKEMETKKN
mgnify:CR=1 FL=1